MEVRSLFIDYLIGSDESPYAPVDAVFVRDEFQDLMGNLPHIHMLLSLVLRTHARTHITLVVLKNFIIV